MSRFAAGESLHPANRSPDEIGRLDAEFRGMTEQLTAARRQLESRNEELARVNVEKNHFMGMAAHDLRNPLFGASMAVDALLKRGGLAERDQAMLRRMQASLKAMSNLVSDFLDVSLIESGGTNGAAVANVDRDKISQVMTNFLTNAVKYSHAGSQVELSVIEFDSTVRVSVRDEGQGIASEELERLFKPFSRASAKPTAGKTSTGLGLAICRKVVEGHGGRIGAESEVGKGSLFWFEVPR